MSELKIILGSAAPYKWVLIVIELFNFADNDFGTKK